MFREFGIPQALVIYGLIVPLAILLGFMLATPLAMSSLMTVAVLISIAFIPVILKHHYLSVIACWNAVFIVFFLPGQPTVGILVAAICAGIAILNRTLRKQTDMIWVPSVTRPIIVLAIVVFATAQISGGIGGRLLGTESWGAKRYLTLVGAILGYFAITSQRIPRERAILYASIFFLSGMTAMASDLIFLVGPSLYFLYAFFQSDYAVMQASSSDSLFRLAGVAFACTAGFYFLLMRFGIRGVFDLSKPWRILLLVAFGIGSLFGGYRSLVILLAILFAFQFFFEGLQRTKYLPILTCVGILCFVVLLVFMKQMPLSVQRAFSFLPVEIDQTARQDALGTLDWRVTMWKLVLPEVPKYLLVGKGFSYNGTDYYLTSEAVRRGMVAAYEDTLISGNYHNGFLTLIVPFGIWGFLAFLWFCWASLKVLYNNYRYGAQELQKINTFLFAYFSARMTFFFAFYGQFDLDLPHFMSTVALSIALNWGVRSASAPDPVEVPMEAPPQPFFAIAHRNRMRPATPG